MIILLSITAIYALCALATFVDLAELQGQQL